MTARDVYVPGSRRYANPTEYLIPADVWPTQRDEFCRLVGIRADPATALADVEVELTTALGELEAVLAGGQGPYLAAGVTDPSTGPDCRYPGTSRLPPTGEACPP